MTTQLFSITLYNNKKNYSPKTVAFQINTLMKFSVTNNNRNVIGQLTLILLFLVKTS